MRKTASQRRSGGRRATLLPVTDLLDLLTNLISPERDEEHDTLADLTLDHRADAVSSQSQDTGTGVNTNHCGFTASCDIFKILLSRS